MPELPDILLYLAALQPRIVGRPLQRVQLMSPFLLRTVDPRIDEAQGKTITGLRRLGKRIVWELENDLFLVFHLMIAGRFRWSDGPWTSTRDRAALAVFEFPNGTVRLVEAGSKKRASLSLVRGETALAAHNPGGLEVTEASRDRFAAVLAKENHTLKRALTDPHLFSGIGNAYSDEILHAALLSPLKMTSQLAPEEVGRLYHATRQVLTNWTVRLQKEFGSRFPGAGDVTAFRPDFAVHGKFGQPCPACGTKVQRIRYTENETNYCPRCQTGGRILADRSLSRLLKDDWPRTVEELEG